MISEVTFNAIAGAAEKLKTMSVGLSVEQNTAMSMLSDSANTPLIGMTSITDAEFYMQFPDSLNRDSITGSTEPYELMLQDGEKVIMPTVGDHEIVMQALSKMGRQRTGELRDYSRNIVQPFVSTIVDGYAEPNPSELAEQWCIVDVAIHPAYLNPLVESLLGQFGDIRNWEISTGDLTVKVPTDLQIPSTGRASFDDLISGLLTSMSMSPSDALIKLFSDGTENPYGPDSWIKAPLHLAQWLLINYYESSPWDDSGLSGLSWETFCTQYKDALTGWIHNYVRNMSELIDSNTLVMGTNFERREIFVVTDVYRDFITKHAGTVETIYGAMYLLEDGVALNNYMLDTFVSRAAECEQAWARQVSIVENQLNSNWVVSAREHMKASFNEALDSLDDGILPDDVSKSTVGKKCNVLIDERLDRFSMEDPTLLIIGIVGDAVFDYTDCGWMLSEIHKRMCLGMDGSEAATQVAIDYTVSWTLSSIRVS